MKKSLSFLLALIMTLSVFSAAAVPAEALTANDLFVISKTDFANDEITYTVKLAGEAKNLIGSNFDMEFDSTQLRLESCSVSSAFSAGGMFTNGFKYNSVDKYGIATTYVDPVTKAAGTVAFTLKFKAISEERINATVAIYCRQFNTADNDSTNDIWALKDEERQLFFADEFHTLSKPVISAVDSYDEDSLKVQWNSCTGADYYNVYRKAGTEWSLLAEGVAAIEYIDNTITQGVEYSYLVTAVNEAGETAVAGNGVAGMNFGAISFISADALANGIQVNWTALNGAVKYEVLRRIEGDSAYTVIAKNITAADYANGDNFSYADRTASSGITYEYAVRAYHSLGYSAGINVQPAKCRYIGMPAINMVNTNDGIQLTITGVGGAENYYVFKKVDGGAEALLATIPSSSLELNKYTFTDTAVADGEKYVYSIYATAGEDKSHTTTRDLFTRLAKPVLSSVVNTEAGIKLQWSTVANADLYTVYRKTENSSYVKIGESTSALTFVDPSAVNNTLYDYAVVAENETGCSAYSVSKVIKRVNTPASLKATTKSNGISLTWASVDGATNYAVYRKTNSTDYEFLTTVADAAFVDTTAAQNVQYTYNVKAEIGTYESGLSATGVAGMNFGTVTSLTYTAIKNGVKLQWNQLANAKGYRIYRKTLSDADYTLAFTVTTGNTYEDTKISSGIVYNYKVEAYNGANIAEMTAPVLSAKFLAAPSFTAKNSGDSVKVTITPVYGAESYIIERADGTGTDFRVLTTLSKDALEYLDSDNIVEGEKYTYRVTAVAGEIRSFPSTVTMTKMIAPTIFSFYNEVAGVVIKWTPIDDATQYKVWRKLASEDDTAWRVITTTGKSQTEFIDASVIGNEVYQYEVEANTPDGWTGRKPGVENRFIETPDLDKVSNAVGGVQVSWKQVDGATSYRVYRRGAGTNYWYYLGDVPATQTTFLDKEGKAASQIKSGNYYRYTIRASYDGFDSKGNAHLRYSGFDTNGLYLKYMATPKLTGISNAANGLYIKWNAVAGVTNGYRVYRRGAGSTYWTYLGTVKTTYYTDPGVKNANGGYYRYTVIADGGKHSAFDTTGLYLKRLANPVLVSAVSSTAGITVKWNKINGSTGYYVYRKTGSSSWTRVGVVSGVNRVTFLDKSAKKGVTYTYTVRAYSGATMSSYNTKGISCKDRY